MSAKALTHLKDNLLERKYIPSRVACLLLTILLIEYLFPLKGFSIPLVVCSTLAVLLSIQFFFQNPILNIVLGSVMCLIGAYFCIAVIDEFMEFETFSREAWQLLVVGLGLFLSVIFLSILMIRRALLD